MPYLILTKRYRYGIADRIGILPKGLKSVSSKSRIIWVHAVSVGEMKTAGILAVFLRKAFPSHTLVFSTITHTGNHIAKTITIGNEKVFYLPFDISFIVERVVKTIKPEIFLCLETELWPNLIYSLYRNNTRVVLVNGRISDRSYFGYRRLKFITARILAKFSLILMQSEEDARRILELGAEKSRVFVTGNLKFDTSLLDIEDRRRRIRDRLEMRGSDILLIAGSTHRGEEKQIVECYSRLKKDYTNLRLLIAPRHIERVHEIELLLARYGFKSLRFSRVASGIGHPLRGSGANRSEQSANQPHQTHIFLLDTIGELTAIYSAADIVFMGGSLVKKGGQNPIEPAIMAKPIILGRFIFNFYDVVRVFLENKAVLQVKTKDELYCGIKRLLDDIEESDNLGKRAKDTVDKSSGAGRRIVQYLTKR